MFFTAAFALAAASLVMAQDVTINEATLTQVSIFLKKLIPC